MRSPSRIDLWLSGLIAAENSVDPPSPESARRKRKASHDSPAWGEANRRPLESLSPNQIAKRPRLHPPPKMGRGVDVVDEAGQKTPRASRRQTSALRRKQTGSPRRPSSQPAPNHERTGPAFPLPPPPTSAIFAVPEHSKQEVTPQDSRSNMSGASSNRSNASRSSSPSKNKQMAALLHPRVHWDHSATTSLDAPVEMQSLYKDIARIAKAQIEALVPREVADTMEALLKTEFDQDVMKSARDMSEERAELFDIFLTGFEEVEEIVRCAVECEKFVQAEAAWNEPQKRLLDLALKDFASLRCRNITRAALMPSCLPISQNGTPAPGKMLDFAVTLYSEDFSAFRETVRSEVGSRKALQSINPSEYCVLMLEPVGLYVETKVNGGMDEAYTQLAIWTAAHFGFLVDQGLAPHPIPLIIVSRHDWSLYIASMADSHISIVRCAEIGNTRDLSGVMRLLACLQRLAIWLQTDYRDWFCKFVLKKKPEQLPMKVPKAKPSRANLLQQARTEARQLDFRIRTNQ